MTYAPTIVTRSQPKIADLELDTILRLKQAVHDMALVFADDQEDQVPYHLQAGFEEVKYAFLDGREYDERTPIVFQTVHNLLFAA